MWINLRHVASPCAAESCAQVESSSPPAEYSLAEHEPQSINESNEVMMNSQVDMNSHTWGFPEVGLPQNHPL